ncbi:hypothetical protein GGI05_004863, partial [Coemansia sp. RSA 2603]
MNSFFGGTPLGPSRSSTPAPAGSPPGRPASQAETAGAASNGKPLGAWGSMFKSALSQVETHLDRYLDLPADAAAQQQARKAQPPLRSTTPVAVPASGKAVGAGVRRSASRSSLPRSSSVVSSNAATGSTADAVELDAGLQDAFGDVALDDQPDAHTQEEIRKLRQATQAASTVDEQRRMLAQHAKRIEALLLEGQRWARTEHRLTTVAKKLRQDLRASEAALQAERRRAADAERRALASSSDTAELQALRAQLSDEQAARARAESAVSAMQRAAVAAEEEAREREAAALTHVRELKTQLRQAAPLPDSAATAQLHQQADELRVRLADLRRECAVREQALADAAREARREAARERALREQGEAHVREMLAAREVLEKRRADAEAEARRLRDAGARDARALADARRMLEETRGQVGALQGRLDALEKERQVPRLSPVHVRSPSTASTQSQSEPPAPTPPSASASAARKLSAQVSSLKAQLHA